MHYLFGALPARLGDEMSAQALLLAGLVFTGSAAISSSLLAALTFSAAIGGPVLGAVLDRSHRPGPVLATALGLYALGVGFIVVLLGTTTVVWPITAALVAGLLMPAISGGWSSRLRSFIADEQLVRASAIDATTFNIAGLVGPALAGLLAVWLGANWMIVVLIVLLLAAMPMAWLLPGRGNARGIHATTFLQDIAAGFRVIATNKALLRITLLSVTSYAGIGMLWVTCPLIGAEHFGNAGFGGIMMSVLSVGALIATIAYAKWPTHYSADHIAFITTLILALALFVLALAGSSWLIFSAMLLAGLADGPQLAAVFAVRHREAPERSRSQVFTTGASLKISAAALGAALAGQLAAYSIGLVLLVAVGVQILAAISFVIIRQPKR